MKNDPFGQAIPQVAQKAFRAARATGVLDAQESRGVQITGNDYA